MSNDARAKTERVLSALEHREPDRVPVGEFFWTNFVRRCRRELGAGDDFNPYRYWDLDLIVVTPNMDPHICGIEVLEDTPERKVVKTGFGATIERRGTLPMPHFLDFETRSFEQMEALEFDDPKDPRRYVEPIDDQINAVGDELNLGLPPFVDRLAACAGDFCVFGSVCEPHEMLWRTIGTENALLKIAEAPDRLARFIERLGDFLVGIVEGQVAAARSKLAGLYIWGDIAYDHGMFFSPRYWRDAYKPQLKRICDAAHRAGLKTIYHGCGNASAVFEDLIEAGVDAYNPLEAKAGLDVLDLKRRFGRRWAFNGNIDVRVLATNDRAKIRAEVLRKLNAAKGGGYIFQSDHSVPDNVAPATYAYVIQLVREHGTYPLNLDEFEVNSVNLPRGGFAAPLAGRWLFAARGKPRGEPGARAGGEGEGGEAAGGSRGHRMNSRGRVLTTFAHEEPDRVPMWCGASAEFWAKAKAHLGLDDEALRERFHDDFRRVFARYAGPDFTLREGATCRTVFGVERHGMGYGQPMSHPLAGATLDQVHAYAWPDPAWMDVSGVRADAEAWRGEYAILGGDWSPFFHDAIDLLGMEGLYLQIYDEPAVVDAVMGHLVDYYFEVSRRIFEAAGGAIDIFFVGNDFGSQRGPLLSPAQFERFILPHLSRLIDLGHHYRLKVMLHCCGGIEPLMQVMIRVGLDALHAVQPSCTGMDLATLKREYGDAIVFNGGIDSHHVLIKGTPETVRRQTREVLDIMAPSGGYIAGASHDSILEETPVENVLAMFDTVMEYRTGS